MALDTPPSFIVDSGNGIQPVWLLADPIEANEEYRQAAESLCAQIEAALGAKGTHNVDRLLCVPGTRNFPNAKKRALGRDETQARLLCWTWCRYSWTDLEQLAEHLRCNPPRHAVPCEPPRPRASLGDIALPETRQSRSRPSAWPNCGNSIPRYLISPATMATSRARTSLWPGWPRAWAGRSAMPGG